VQWQQHDPPFSHLNLTHLGGDGNGRVIVTVSFTGEYPQRVDGKGRVMIPAPVRRVLDAGDPDRPDGTLPRFQLSYGNHLPGHLRIYTIKAFEDIKSRIEARMDGTVEMRNLAYTYLTQSAELEVDKDGRIVLPARQRDKIGVVEGEVSFMGFGAYCEVWKAETFAQNTGASVDEWLSANGPNFDPISILGPAGGGRTGGG
jgi:MraZ protein